jgi:hypothetical protein
LRLATAAPIALHANADAATTPKAAAVVDLNG